MKKYILTFLCFLSFGFAQASAPMTARPASELETVPAIDAGRYVGRWYQQSRNPLPFEPLDCWCALQTLSANADGTVSVFNSCNKDSARGPLLGIIGSATIDNPGFNTKLSVDFGFPKKGQYWIIGVDHDYRWAVVSEPSKASLYILSKTPVLAPELYEAALAAAATQVTLEKLRPTSQENCQYPTLQ